MQSLMAFVSERLKFSLESFVQIRENELGHQDIVDMEAWISNEHLSNMVPRFFLDVFLDYLTMFHCATVTWVTAPEFLNMFQELPELVGKMFLGNMVLEKDMDGISPIVDPLLEDDPEDFSTIVEDVTANLNLAHHLHDNQQPTYQLTLFALRLNFFAEHHVPFAGFELVLNNETFEPLWGDFRGDERRLPLGSFRNDHPVNTTTVEIWATYLWEPLAQGYRLNKHEHNLEEAEKNDDSVVHDFPLRLTKRHTNADGTERIETVRGNEVFPPLRTLLLTMYIPQFAEEDDRYKPAWISVKRQHDKQFPWFFGGGSFLNIYGTDDVERIHSGQNIRQPYTQPASEVLQPRAPQQEPRRRELVNYAKQIEDYEQDIQDSDNEFDEVSPQETAVLHRDNNYPFLNNIEDVEAFYAEILGWLVNPDNIATRGHINSSTRSNAYWLEEVFKGPGKFILRNVSNAPDLKAYSMHTMALLMLTCRANVIQALKEDKFLPLKNRDFMDDLHHADHRDDCGIEFLEMEIQEVSATPTLLHFTATSENEQLNRHILDDCLMGLTLCIAQVERGLTSRRCPIPRKSTRRSQDMTHLMFCLIRRVAVHHLETGDEIELEVGQAAIEQLTVRMTMSREALRLEGFCLEPGQSIRFVPVCSLASEFRILKAIPRLALIPDNFRERMFGNRLVKVPYNQVEVRQPPSNSILTEAMTIGAFHEDPAAIRQMVEAQTDNGCRDYLVRCANRNDCEVHESHFNALLQMTRVLGDAAPGTSGMGMIKGPPGTGKTTTIIHLLGALLHHSEYGHMVPIDQQVTHVRTPATDTRMRRSRNPNALKILVVASSNAAVDNILERLHENGIPDGHGGTLRPRMLRIARHNHVPKHPLGQYLIRSEARLYDEGHEERNNPSLAAKRACADECIIFLTTANCAGSGQLKELNQVFDAVIQDEAGFTLEWETLVPLTAACTHRDLGCGRLYYFAIGDEKQLPALSFIPNMILSAGVMREAPFDVATVQRSLFERLIMGRRVTFFFLSAQFRMHPTISHLTSPPVYNHYFDCPVPLPEFQRRYNQPQVYNDGFYPMSFLDTSGIAEMDRAERDEGNGNITNNLEAQIVVQLVDTLFDLVGDEVNNQIAVICPYRTQVDCISTKLRLRSRALERNNHRQPGQPQRNVTVCTVDAMQGSQRSVVIFSMTRSNRHGDVGFVKEMRRLNVSLSRARYLNIIVGDMSTMDTNPIDQGRYYGKRSRFGNFSSTGSRAFGKHRSRATRGIPTIMNIYDRCSTHEEQGARVARVTRNAELTASPTNNNPMFHIDYLPMRTIPATRGQRSAQNAAGRSTLMRVIPTFNFFTLYNQNGAPGAAGGAGPSSAAGPS